VPDAARAGEDDTADADGDFDALDRL